MAAAINIVLNAVDKYSQTLTGLNQGLELVSKSIAAVGVATDLATGGFGLLFRAASTLTSLAFSPITLAFEAMYNSVIAVRDAVTFLFDTLWSGIQYAADFSWDTIKSISGYLYDSFKFSLDYIWGRVKDLGNFAWSVTRDFAVNFTQSLYKVGTDFELLDVKMGAIFGAGGASQAALDWAVSFGAKTPLTLKEVTDGMIRLKTYGFDPMAGMFEKLGNASFALGADFDGIVRALGQMKLKGKVTAEELQQLAERNINAYEILGKKFNLTGKQLGSIGNVGLDVNEAIEAIVDTLGTKYEGAMKKAANTTVGAVTTIGDIWTVFQKQVNDTGLWDTVTKQVVGFRDFLSTTLGGSFGKTLASTIGNTFSQALSSLGSGGYAQKFVINMMKTTIDALRAIRAVIPDMLASIDILFVEAMKAYRGYIKGLGKGLKLVVPIIKNVLKFLPDINKAFFASTKAIFGFISASVPSAIAIISGVFTQSKQLVDDATLQIKQWSRSIDTIEIKQKAMNSFKAVYDTVVLIGKAMYKVATNIDWNKLWDYTLIAVNKVLQGVDYIDKYLTKVFKNMGGINGITKKIYTNINKAISFIETSLSKLQVFIIDLFDFVAKGFKLTFNFAKGLFNYLVKGATSLMPVIGNIAKEISKTIKSFSINTYITKTKFAFVGLFSFVQTGFLKMVEGLNDTLLGWANKLAKILKPLSYVSETAENGLEAIEMYKALDVAGKLKKSLAETKLLARGAAEAILSEFNADKFSFGFKSPDFAPIKASFEKLTGGLEGMFAKSKKQFDDIFATDKKVKITVDDESVEEWAKRVGAMKAPGFGGFPGDKSLEIGISQEALNTIQNGFGIKGLEDIELGRFNKDIDVNVNVNDKEIEKLKGEIIVSLQKDESLASRISENEMLVALSKLLRDSLVQLAQGEPTPLVYS